MMKITLVKHFKFAIRPMAADKILTLSVLIPS